MWFGSPGRSIVRVWQCFEFLWPTCSCGRVDAAVSVRRTRRDRKKRKREKKTRCTCYVLHTPNLLPDGVACLIMVRLLHSCGQLLYTGSVALSQCAVSTAVSYTPPDLGNELAEGCRFHYSVLGVVLPRTPFFWNASFR